MTFTEWIKGEKGRASQIAAHFGCTPAAVSQWQQNGVPTRYMKAVRDLSDGAVTLEEMLPDPVTPGADE